MRQRGTLPRAVALDLGLGARGEVRFRTDAGVQRARRTPDGRAIELQFGRVERGTPREVTANERAFAGWFVRPGVPHFVVGVERVEWVPLAEWGSALRHHAAFAPAGANVDFVARLEPGRVAMRTYERGVEAETLACGSGAIAAALWAAEQGDASPIRVLTAGGDELRVGFQVQDGAAEVTLTGPAEVAYRGEWNEPAALAAGRV